MGHPEYTGREASILDWQSFPAGKCEEVRANSGGSIEFDLLPSDSEDATVSEKQVIIFGGDPSGLAAALEQAEAGMQFTLLEPLPSLGGRRIPQDRIITADTPFADPRIEAVRHDRPDDSVDLSQVTQSAVADINATQSGIGAVMTPESVSHAPLPGDAGQLSQLVRNLIENGIRHGGANEPVSVSVLRDSDTVELIVSDRGAGIEPQHLPRLTERFYRVDASRSRDAGGTGLGLAIVKHIVARHRGQLDISSEPVSYTHLRAHETVLDLVCRLLLEKKNKTNNITAIITSTILL